MAGNKKPPTVASLSAVLAELVERVKEQQTQIVDLQAAQKDQQTLNGLQTKRSDRLAETDETIDSFLGQTHGQLQRLQVQCDSEFVTKTAIQDEMRRFNDSKEDLLIRWGVDTADLESKILLVKSNLTHLQGFVEGTTTGFSQRHGYLEERVDAISDRVFREGWRDRLGRWCWWVGEQLFRITHRRQWREVQDNDDYAK